MNFFDDNSALKDNGSKAPEEMWLLGFGDLSTLILCFFLALLISSPVNPAYRRGNSQLGVEPGDGPFEAQAKIETVFSDSVKPGTELAKPISDESYKELILLRSYYDEEMNIASLLQKSVLNGIDLGVYEVSELSIETCSPNEGIPKETDWYLSLSNALSTRRQLVDAGIRSKVIEVGVLGPWCEVLKFKDTKDPSNDVAGILRIKISPRQIESTVS